MKTKTQYKEFEIKTEWYLKELHENWYGIMGISLVFFSFCFLFSLYYSINEEPVYITSLIGVAFTLLFIIINICRLRRKKYLVVKSKDKKDKARK